MFQENVSCRHYISLVPRARGGAWGWGYSLHVIFSDFSTDVLKFDNSYSWTRAKEVFYSVKIVAPGSESDFSETKQDDN